MTLADQDKVDIRFFLGYGMRGDDNITTQGEIYARTYNPWLEDRMSHLTTSETARVLLILNDIRDMEAEIISARQLLNIESAGSFKRNPREMPERVAQYNRRRKQLARFFNTTVNNTEYGGIV